MMVMSDIYGLMEYAQQTNYPHVLNQQYSQLANGWASNCPVPKKELNKNLLLLLEEK